MKAYQEYNHAGEVPFEQWRVERGVKIPIFDNDGTLCEFDTENLDPQVIDGLRSQGFSDIFPRVAIVSNNLNAAHVEKIADKFRMVLDLEEVFAVTPLDRTMRKPKTAMGSKVATHYGLYDESDLGVVGDRLLVDVAFGKNLGAAAIALCSRIGTRDASFVPLVRSMEKVLIGGARVVDTLKGLGIAFTKPA